MAQTLWLGWWEGVRLPGWSLGIFLVSWKMGIEWNVLVKGWKILLCSPWWLTSQFRGLFETESRVLWSGVIFLPAESRRHHSLECFPSRPIFVDLFLGCLANLELKPPLLKKSLNWFQFDLLWSCLNLGRVCWVQKEGPPHDHLSERLSVFGSLFFLFLVSNRILSNFQIIYLPRRGMPLQWPLNGSQLAMPGARGLFLLWQPNTWL